MVKYFIALAPLTAAACSTAQQPTAASGACPLIASSDWAAWVDTMPGEGGPRLIVTGKATVPTGGYRFDWADPVVAESSPIQISVQLRPVTPSGMAMQAIVTHEVRSEWRSEKRVGSVRILCGGQQLALISPVETAQ